MTRRIRQAPVLEDADRAVLFHWAPDPFGSQLLPIQWRPKDEHFIADVDGRPVSHVGLVRHTIRVGDRRLDVAGLGGVITVPEAQGQGHAAALIDRAMQFAFENWRVDAALLFCFPRMEPYYTRLGWRVLDHPVMVMQPSGVVEMPISAMVFPADRVSTVDAPIELDSLPW